MDVLKVGSKNYVKASVLARELGYTTDYVGQLCRARKVNAQLVGRSWYVDRDSIADHKSNRYRSTQAKSIKALQQKDEEEATPIPIHTGSAGFSVKNDSRFYSHSTLKPSPRYAPDESELFPTVGNIEKKQGNLRVNLADAESVKISNASEAYVFETPALPQIKFRGSLSITEAEDPGREAPEGGVLLHPKTVSVLKSDKKAHNKVISATIERTETASNVQEEGVKIVPVDLEPTIVTEVVMSSGLAPQKSPFGIVSVAITTVVSFACVILLLGLETHVQVAGSTFQTQYVFKIDHLVASAYSAISESGLPFSGL